MGTAEVVIVTNQNLTWICMVTLLFSCHPRLPEIQDGGNLEQAREFFTDRVNLPASQRKEFLAIHHQVFTGGWRSGEDKSGAV